MTISIITCVTKYKSKLLIGKNNGLVFNLHRDLQYFSHITKNYNKINKPSYKNVVVMGMKTWESLPEKYRPLPDRLNIVLTRSEEVIKDKPFPLFKTSAKNIFKQDFYFCNFDQFSQFYNKFLPNVFVIGGGEIYELFLSDENLKPTSLFVTHVTKHNLDLQTFENQELVTINNISKEYALIGYSEKYIENDGELEFRFLQYKLDTHSGDSNSSETPDKKYFELCNYIIENGNSRKDRTNTGTFSVFGYSYSLDISKYVPILTTKSVPVKSCIEELLWFLRGDTDSRILQKQGVKIWNGNSSDEFIKSRGLDYNTGICGPIYGWQWRFFGAEYDEKYSNTNYLKSRNIVGGFDQIEYVENLLRTDPFSRRILLSAWNPNDLNKMVLPPCHYSVQFYVEKEKISSELILNCMFNMRSNDIFLGHPFNILSYSILTYILAKRCDMKPGKLIYNGGDVHIYNDHILQINKQLTRTETSRSFLHVSDRIKNIPLHDITTDDFEIIGYFPHSAIRGNMSV